MILNLKYKTILSGLYGAAILGTGMAPVWVCAQTNSQIANITKAAKFDDVREVVVFSIAMDIPKLTYLSYLT